MAVSYLIKFNVAPQFRNEFVALISKVLDAMRDEPTFHQAVLHRDEENENRFMLFETWENHEEVLQVQLRRPYRQAWHEALARILLEDRDIAIWRPLRADRRSE